MGVLSALCSQSDVFIFSDELNHASIVDGCKLASKGGAKVAVYRWVQVPKALISKC